MVKRVDCTVIGSVRLGGPSRSNAKPTAPSTWPGAINATNAPSENFGGLSVVTETEPNGDSTEDGPGPIYEPNGCGERLLELGLVLDMCA